LGVEGKDHMNSHVFPIFWTLIVATEKNGGLQ
jgi:hypothetical protein